MQNKEIHHILKCIMYKISTMTESIVVAFLSPHALKFWGIVAPSRLVFSPGSH